MRRAEVESERTPARHDRRARLDVRRDRRADRHGERALGDDLGFVPFVSREQTDARARAAVPSLRWCSDPDATRRVTHDRLVPWLGGRHRGIAGGG